MNAGEKQCKCFELLITQTIVKQFHNTMHNTTESGEAVILQSVN
jgi:hypothetical protein